MTRFSSGNSIEAIAHWFDTNVQAEGQLLNVQHAVLEHMGDGVVAVDTDGRFLLFNAAARRIYGRGPVSAGTDQWSEVYGAFEADGITPFPAHALPLARALRGESSDQVELFFRNPAHPQGIWIASTGRPLLDADGHVRGGIVVLRDITRHRQTEDEVRRTNQQLTELVQEKATLLRQSHHIAEMSSFLQACETIEELYTVVCEYIARLLPNSSGAFYVYSASRDDLEQVTRWGDPDVTVPPVMKPSDCWALRRGRLHASGGGKTHLSCTHSGVTLRPYVCVPVLGPQETIGVLHLAGFRMLDRQQDGPLALEQPLTTAAEYIAMALVNLRLRTALRSQSIRDPLTGLFNRRFLEETLSQAMRRADRTGASVSVLMLDIDSFKRFNDTHGHVAGDEVLRQFANLLLEDSRGGDIAARYGGEEFTLVLPDTQLAAARERAQRVLEQTKRLRLGGGGAIGTVSVSIGIACYPEHGSSTLDLLEAADAALYGAKQAGRDCVTVALGPANRNQSS